MEPKDKQFKGMEDFMKKFTKTQEALMPQIKSVIDEVKIMNSPLQSKQIEYNDTTVVMSTLANNKITITFPDAELMNIYFSKTPVITAEEFIKNGTEMTMTGREFGYKKCNAEWINKPWYKRLFTKWQ